MSLEYSDDNELIYQAKAAAKDIVNAKYEVTKKIGDFLFLAHSEEEFYQRAIAVDPILESTSTRRLASVSDSKAKLVKALLQEWEIKHANCTACTKIAQEVSTQDEKDKEQAIKDASDVQKQSKEDSKEASAKGSSEKNFNLPERVASPVAPSGRKTNNTGVSSQRKLWDKWSILRKKKEKPGYSQKLLSDPSISPETRDLAKVKFTDSIIARSLGRADDPEVRKQITPDSVLWVDPYGHYGSDKKRKFSALRGRRQEGQPGMGEASESTAMMFRPAGRRSLGNDGLLLTHYRCTGKTFEGFNGNQTGTFPQCQHEHHEGDGCGLTSDVASEGSMQPGCGQQHMIGTAVTPHLIHNSSNAETGEPESVWPIPYLSDETSNNREKTDPSGLQADMNRAVTPEQRDALKYTNPTQEQVGEIPFDRAWLMHPDDAKRFAGSLDHYHQAKGRTGRHPANLDEFTIGDKTHRVGDIVSTSREGTTENELGVVAGATMHQNGQNIRFGRLNGLGANTDNDSSRAAANPGDYSLMIHKLNIPKPGHGQPTAVDPDTGNVTAKVNETTMHYPSSSVETIAKGGTSFKRGRGDKSSSPLSKLYSTVKGLQSTFRAKPAPIRDEKPKTVKPSRDNLDISTLDLGALFGDSDE